MVSSCAGVGPGSPRLLAEAREFIAVSTSIVCPSIERPASRLLAQAVGFANVGAGTTGAKRANSPPFPSARRIFVISRLDRRTVLSGSVGLLAGAMTRPAFAQTATMTHPFDNG